MALGALTKQLATQALGESVNSVIDTLRPQEAGKGEKTAGVGPGEAGQVILGQIQAMQKAMKDEQELVVLCSAGEEMLRVLEIYVPSWQVFVLTGVDAEKNVTRFVSAVDALQLVCKVMRVKQDAKPVRLNFITPKPKPE